MNIKTIENSSKIIVIPNQNFEIEIENILDEIGISVKELIAKPDWYKIDNDWWYFKKIDTLELFINELLGQYLANYFKLETIKFKLAVNIYNGKTAYGLLSKNFRKKGINYVDARALGLEAKVPDGLTNIVLIKKFFESEIVYNFFISRLLKLTALDLYMHQTDRVNQNLLFIKNEKSLGLGPIYDYSATFDYIDNTLYCYMYDYPANFHWILNENYIYSNTLFKLVFPSREMINLFNQYPSFYKDLMSIMNINMKAFLSKIEREYDIKIPASIKNDYLEFDNNQKKFIKSIL